MLSFLMAVALGAGITDGQQPNLPFADHRRLSAQNCSEKTVIAENIAIAKFAKNIQSMRPSQDSIVNILAGGPRNDFSKIASRRNIERRLERLVKSKIRQMARQGVLETLEDMTKFAVAGWRRPKVFKRYIELVRSVAIFCPFGLRFDARSIVAEINIGSELSFSTIPVLPQVLHKSYERSARQGRLQDHRPEHPISKNRHGLLGSQIALLALIGVAGLGLGYQAFNRAVDSRHISKTVAWAIGWVGLSAIGAYGLVMALLGCID